MRVPLFKRLVVTFFNICFPPLAVALLTGFTSSDTILNACLFLLAVIPSHIHGFYISLVYFGRKRKVRKGKWPGKPHKPGIWSEKVLTGGAGWDEAERLKYANTNKRNANGLVDDRYGEGELSRRPSGRSGHSARRKRRSQVRSSVSEGGGVSTVQTHMTDNAMCRMHSAGPPHSRTRQRN